MLCLFWILKSELVLVLVSMNPLIDIRKVNDKMENQKCEAKRVVSGNNWEDYMWPHQIDKNAVPAVPAAPAVPAKLPQSRQTFHVNVGGTNSGHNFLNNLKDISCFKGSEIANLGNKG